MSGRTAATVGCIILALSLSEAQVLAADTLDARRLAGIREVTDPALSPDGRRVAYTVDNPGSRSNPDSDIWVAPTSGDAAPEPLVEGSGADTAPAWSPNGEQLAFLSDGFSEQSNRQGLYVIGANGEDRRLLSAGQLPVRKFEWSPRGNRIAFLANGLWTVDLDSGRLVRAGGTGRNVLDLSWSPDGKRIAVNDDNELVIVDTQTGSKLATLADRASKPWSRRQIFDWSPDGRRILYAELASEQKSPAGIGFWMAVIPATGGEPTPVLKDHPGTITQAQWSSDSGHLFAQSFEGTRSKILRIDVESGTSEVLIDRIFEEKSFSVDRDGQSFAWLSSTYELPVDVWFRGPDEQKRRLTAVNDDLKSVRTGEVRQFRWNSASGRTLYGLLVLPVDYVEDRAYPTVVQLHGGPHFAWWEGWLGSWHDWAQLLATNGYAVFLPNPRGSTGQGLEFSLANVNDIAIGPFEDVMRGVDRLIESGIADPDRLGVGGWSYGGYLTAWTITQTDRFRAAVIGAGISRVTKRSHMLLKEYYGNIDVRERYDHLAKVSPDNFLENIVTPTLVIHGKEDSKISYRQAVELHYGLAELSVDTELILFEHEGHGIASMENRVQMLASIVSWYDKHLKGDPVAGEVSRSGRARSVP